MPILWDGKINCIHRGRQQNGGTRGEHLSHQQQSSACQNSCSVLELQQRVHRFQQPWAVGPGLSIMLTAISERVQLILCLPFVACLT